MNIKEFIDDIAAFADDEGDILAQRDGQVIFTRNGKEISARFIDDEDGAPTVEVEGRVYPYRKFLAEFLANLSVFADRLFSKRSTLQVFVDGEARLESVSLVPESSKALQLLREELDHPSPFSSRVIFVTADAGHGKTVLLRQFQMENALAYIEGRSRYLFWHVDLQGRQLLRLSEALMGDLGDLRISGLYMPGIVRLLHHRLIVLAIDGFDELAAEQGSTDALGALALLVQQMHDRGSIVAASRRTFFDTEDYSRRSGILRRHVSPDCEFDQLHLLPWTPQEAVQFLSEFRFEGKGFSNSTATLQEIADELGSYSHPMIQTPFLLAHVARGLLMYDLTPREFISGMQNPLESVSSVVTAFVEREVADKWKKKETGEAYLTVAQHIELLANVAEEMWESQVERLGVDLIETVTASLLESWNIEQDRQRQVFEMVRMHVLLTVPADGDSRYRSFDHPEFRAYFIAKSLASLIKHALEGKHLSRLSRFLAIGQLPDSVARYVFVALDKNSVSGGEILGLFTQMVKNEWRPTYLQSNIGILIPQLLSVMKPGEPVICEAKIMYSGLVFEGSRLENVIFRGGTFSRVRFTDVYWKNVSFENCELQDITVDVISTYSDVTLIKCKIQGLRIVDNEEEERREYSPLRIQEALKAVGITFIDDEAQSELFFTPKVQGERYKCARKLLRAFLNSTSITDKILSIRFRGSSMNLLKEEVLPLMVTCGLLRPEEHHGGGPVQLKWRLQMTMEEILQADGDSTGGAAKEFWEKIALLDSGDQSGN